MTIEGTTQNSCIKVSNQTIKNEYNITLIVGVNTFRVTQEYKDSYMLDDGELLQVFKKCKDLGAYVTTLAENGHIVDKVSLSDFY